MGLWLELIYLSFTAFYDKSLTTEDCMRNIMAARTVLLAWKENCEKWKAKGKHFITAPTFQDLITGLEGMVHYLFQCATKYKDCDIAPWHFVSDSCEQLFAFLRTGFHKGRQTNLSSARGSKEKSVH